MSDDHTQDEALVLEWTEHARSFGDLNAYDVLWPKRVVFTRPAFEALLESRNVPNPKGAGGAGPPGPNAGPDA